MAAPQHDQAQRVKVVDFDMSIGSLIGLFIKMAIASIPAMIIIWVITMLFGAMAMAVLGVGGGLLAAGADEPAAVTQEAEQY